MSNKVRACARIDLGAIYHNINILKNANPQVDIMAVIKANGYGHGAVPIASYLEGKEGICSFAVATVEEALELRNAGIKSPILILSYTFSEDNTILIEHGIRPSLFTRESALEFSKAAVDYFKNNPGTDRSKAPVHIKVDSGMSRIGILPDREGLDFVRFVRDLPGIEIEGIFTHFARADEEDIAPALKAEDKFNSFVDELKKAGINIPLVHSQNSAGGLRSLSGGKNLLRAGIAMYGLWPSNTLEKEGKWDLTPALSLHSTIIHLKTIPKGTQVSYGGTYVASSPRLIATIPIGYGDGYPRQLSGKGRVLIRGMRAPIAGRICMDALMADVTDIPGVSVGDEVVLIGKSGSEEITAGELGELSGRFNYELMCCITSRVPRVYYGDK